MPTDHENELVRRLRVRDDNGYIGGANQTVRCSAASWIEAFADRTVIWESIDTVPIDVPVLLFCPTRHVTNVERIEVAVARTSNGSHHSWATHWAQLPTGPDRHEIDRILADEDGREYREREMEQLAHDGQP